jgi:hypothetical protein
MGWVVSVMSWLCFTPGERTPSTHWIGGCVGLRSGLDTQSTGKIHCLYQGSNSDRPVIQSCSQTLYWLSVSRMKCECMGELVMVSINWAMLMVCHSACRMWGTSSHRRQGGDPWLKAGETLRLPSCAHIRWFKSPLKCGAFRPRLKIWFRRYECASNQCERPRRAFNVSVLRGDLSRSTYLN